MGFMAGVGEGFSDTFKQGMQQQNDLKMTVLRAAYDNFARNQANYQKADLDDKKNVVLAKQLVSENNVPVGAWPIVHGWLNGGMSVDDAIKRLQTTQFGPLGTTPPAYNADPSTGLPAGQSTNGQATNDTTMDSQMKNSGLAQPTIDPSLQNGQGASAPQAPQAPGTTTMSGGPAGGAMSGNNPAPPGMGGLNDMQAPASPPQSPVQPQSAPNASPVAQPASNPVESLPTAPVTPINNPQTHPATYNPTNEPADQAATNIGVPSPTADSGIPAETNPVSNIMDRAKLFGQSLFDPKAREQLQKDEGQRRFKWANDQINSMSGTTQDQMNKINAGFTPQYEEPTVKITGYNRAMDPQVAQQMLAGVMPQSLQVAQRKQDTVTALNQYKNLDDIVQAHPQVLTASGPTTAFFNALIEQGKGLFDTVNSGGDISQAIGEQVNQMFPGQAELADAYKQYSAAAINAAYAHARAISGGGTLTDTDFTSGLKSLLTSNNYKTWSTNLRSIAKADIVKTDNAQKDFLASPFLQQFRGTEYEQEFNEYHSPLEQDKTLGAQPLVQWANEKAVDPRLDQQGGNGGGVQNTSQQTPQAQNSNTQIVGSVPKDWAEKKGHPEWTGLGVDASGNIIDANGNIVAASGSMAGK